MLRRTVSCLLMALMPVGAMAESSDCAVPLAANGQMEQRLKDFLQQSSVPAFDRIELSAFMPLPDSTNVQFALRSHWPASRVAVQLRWEECGSQRQRQETVWLKVAAYRQAWVYGKSASAGVPLAQAMPRLLQVDVAPWRLPADELAVPVGDEYLQEPVKAGAPVRRTDLKPAPLVKRNDAVQLVVRGNGVRISTPAKALQPGAAGDWIAVMIAGAEKSTRARVAAEGEVHVDM